MGRTALITGASGGIGKELARAFARDGWDLVLVARNERRLMSLAHELTTVDCIQVQVVVIDLTDADAPERLRAHLETSGITVDCLVNNAGFGDFGDFVDIPEERLLSMIELNVLTLAQLTYLCAIDMKARGHGYILNLGSIASFFPGPKMALYYATKAFVLSLTEALAEELRPYGVTVCALCPGPTSTSFDKNARMAQSPLFKEDRAASAEEVAAFGYRALMAGKVVAVPGALNRLGVFGVRLAPRVVVRKLVGLVQSTRAQA